MEHELQAAQISNKFINYKFTFFCRLKKLVWALIKEAVVVWPRGGLGREQLRETPHATFGISLAFNSKACLLFSGFVPFLGFLYYFCPK